MRLRHASFPIPFRGKFGHVAAMRERAENVIVLAEDEAGHIGLGESCPRSYVTGETVPRRISDKHVLALIKAWLKAPVEERTDTGGRRLTGGKGSKHGTPQGGVISPLLANIYMNRFLKYWRQNGLGTRLKARVVVYAGDLMILTRGFAQEAYAVLRHVMTRIGLTVNETKTKLREARIERFDFLGYTFGPYWNRRTGKRYLGAGPSAKSRKRLKANVHALTKPGNRQPWDEVRDALNAMLLGWQAYFGYGRLKRAYSEAN